MTFVRFAVALVLTIVLLGIAKKTSTRHSTEYSHKIGDIDVIHKTVTEDFGEGPVLKLETAYPESLTAIAYYGAAAGGPYETDTLTQTPEGLITILPVLPKGKEWFYHIDVFRNGEKEAVFPPQGDQFIKFKGHVPPYVIVPHIFFMFATVFFALMTVFTAFSATKGTGEIKKSVRYLLWTVVFVFIGGFPLGFWVAYMAFGQGWGGIPIGWDITDNKTVIIFLFWLVTFILARKGLKGKEMAVSNGVYLALTLISLVVTLALFMVPHSI